MKPGQELIDQGIKDLLEGKETVSSLLVMIGAPRLRRLGLIVPESQITTSPEQRLYQKLSESNPNAAHSQYNALIRRLVSFERAAECEKTQLSRLS